MKSVVKKYGGTSLGSIEKIKQVAQYLQKCHKQGEQIVVVVSAMGNTTNELMQLARRTSSKVNLRTLDALLATGEQKSASLLTMALHDCGVEAICLNAFQLKIKTSDEHSGSRIWDYDHHLLQRYLQNNKIVVVTGFQGINKHGDITTLGRGGSDKTAVVIAAKIQAECQIFTDVKGIYSTDPRIYKQAKLIKKIDYDSLMELAYSGAKIMEPRSVEIAKKYQVHLYVGQSLKPLSEGTYIVKQADIIESKVISGLGIDDNITVMKIVHHSPPPHFSAALFKKIGEYRINVDMISYNFSNQIFEVAFSFKSEQKDQAQKLVQEHQAFFQDLKVNFYDHLVKISLVGIGMATYRGIAFRVFNVFKKANINFYNITTSEISISLTIDQKNKNQAVAALAQEFDL